MRCAGLRAGKFMCRFEGTLVLEGNQQQNVWGFQSSIQTHLALGN